MEVIDDRIVLPLGRIRQSAEVLCLMLCKPWAPHAPECLAPLVAARDALLIEQPKIDQVSGDCQDPVKHRACSGCICLCHRPLTPSPALTAPAVPVEIP